MTPSFIHLRAHTEYSLVDGLIHVKPFVKAVAGANLPAVAITDRMNLFAAVKFYKAAVSAGVKPILGADVCLSNPDHPQKPYLLTLLCQSELGYQNLTRLISKAYTEGQQQGFAQVEKTWLDENSTLGLIALSGAHEGDVGQALLANQFQLASERAAHWAKLFDDRYYIELQRVGRLDEEQYLTSALKLADEKNLPVVATNDLRFIKPDDFEAHEARVCIHSGYTLSDARRPRVYTAEQYLRNADEMQALFSDIPEALANTVEIAQRCNLQISLDKTFLPSFPIPSGMTMETYLNQQAELGLEQRLQQLFGENASQEAAKYKERLKIELDVINPMGFAGYFLIVADFIQWSKNQGIPVGPGRGSGAGSLVAYALQITDLDPLQYDLLFERFLNPERVSMPDFDIDFCMEGRDRVIEYVAQKYGKESVSQIITYGSMAAKAVVRDVGRVLGQPYGFVDKLAKLIPFELGMTLEKALEQEEQLRERYKNEDDVSTLIDLARKLEGTVRNAGKHAGGVVIAPSRLTDFAPLYCEAGGDSIVTQFDKDDIEAVGLVKFDFLGLRTLTIIDWAVQTINDDRRARNEALLDITLLPTDDAPTFELLKACATTAVFQLESRGMKDLIKRLQPDCFEEIIALVALFRPGPLQSGMVDDFINRKHGRAQMAYPHPDLENILRPTYGIILYQEQVMQIAQVLAGYTLGAADLLRRAMGKKKPEEMAKQRTIFLGGALARGVSATTATLIFDLMEKFAGYGFNKSHSAAYALVSYQTAWLKKHYPAEFMAAVLSSDMDNTDKVVNFIGECRNMGVALCLPDINSSDYKFTVASGKILYGLGAIKGAGEAAIVGIVAEREQAGPFRDLFDFCRRIDLRKVNRRVLESLIKAGAFDSLTSERSRLMSSLDIAIQAAEQLAEQKINGQHDLFNEAFTETDGMSTLSLLPVKEWTVEERLLGEKETLGHYVSGHPLQRYEEELAQFVTARLVALKPTKNQTVIVAGLIVGMRTMMTKKGDRMAFVSLDDQTGRIELAVFSETYENHRDLLVKDQLVVVEGEVSVDDYTGGYKMSSRRILSIGKAREIFAKRLSLKVEPGCVNEQFTTKLAGILSPFRSGTCPVCVDYRKEEGRAQLALGSAWRVQPTDELLSELKAWLGASNVVVCYQ